MWGSRRGAGLPGAGPRAAPGYAGRITSFPRRTSRNRSCLRIVLAALGRHRLNGGLRKLQFGVFVDLDDHGGLFDRGDGPVNAADRDDLVAFFHGRDHGLGIFLLLVLGPDDEEIENDENETKRDDGRDHRHTRAAGSLQNDEPGQKLIHYGFLRVKCRGRLARIVLRRQVWHATGIFPKKTALPQRGGTQSYEALSKCGRILKELP